MCAMRGVQAGAGHGWEETGNRNIATPFFWKEAAMEDEMFELQRNASRIRRWFGVAVATAAFGVGVVPALAQQPNTVESAAQRVDDRVDAVDRFIELYVSDNAIQAQYGQELRIEGFGVIEARGGFFYNETRDLIAVADGLLLIGNQAERRLIEVNVGTRLYGAFLNAENEDTFAVGFGGEAQYFFTRDQRSSLKLTAFYAPDILTFGIANNVEDIGLRLQTRIREATDIYVGYRSLEIETTLGKRDVDDNVHIGFRRSF
jgi:hypothetical protein